MIRIKYRTKTIIIVILFLFLIGSIAGYLFYNYSPTKTVLVYNNFNLELIENEYKIVSLIDKKL